MIFLKRLKKEMLHVDFVKSKNFLYVNGLIKEKKSIMVDFYNDIS